MHNTASIGRKWIAAGREHNYGLPTVDERTIPGGAYQVFRRDGRGNGQRAGRPRHRHAPRPQQRPADR